MIKLWKLKYATKVERVSITHDFTLEERRNIKEMVEEAKGRNKNECNVGKQTTTRGN